MQRQRTSSVMPSIRDISGARGASLRIAIALAFASAVQYVPAARAQEARATAGGAQLVALDMDGKKGAVVLHGMPALASGSVYRLWARGADKDVPCGDFSTRPDGQVVAQFTVPVESYTAPLAKLFVTVEPSAGATVPSGPTVMQSV